MLASNFWNAETCGGSITLFGVANCLRYRFNPLARFERERVEFRVGRASDSRHFGICKPKSSVVAGDAEMSRLCFERTVLSFVFGSH
jgi:hypothetical protein